MSICPRTLLCVRKLLFPCLRLGAVTGVTIPGAEATAITNISVSVRERTKEVVNTRLDAMIQKYRPEEDKKAYGYTAFVKPIRDVYRDEDQVKRMDSIMSILALAILFIASLNYVLISISSLTYRAKAVGVHKCSGASGGTVFSMFLLETGIIIALALVLMGLILLNFQEFIEDTTAAKLSVLLHRTVSGAAWLWYWFCSL